MPDQRNTRRRVPALPTVHRSRCHRRRCAPRTGRRGHRLASVHVRELRPADPTRAAHHRTRSCERRVGASRLRGRAVNRQPVRPAEFRTAVGADRRLTQSARRFAEWLSRKRPVLGTDEYPGCQDRAAGALGLSLRTIVTAVALLEHTKYLERVSRGRRHQTCSRFRLHIPEVDQVNVQFLHVDNAE